MIRFLCFLIFCFLNSNLFSQISYGGEPVFIHQEINSIFKVQDVDSGVLLAEDSISDLIGNPPRVAEHIELDVDFFDIAEEISVDQGLVYRVLFSTDNAKSLAFNFDNFYLPEGARLFAYSYDGEHILGSFNSNNNHQTSQFVIGFVQSNEVVLELFVPYKNTSSVILNISHLSYGYKNFLKSGPVDNSGPCQVDVNCSPEGDNFQDEKR